MKTSKRIAVAVLAALAAACIPLSLWGLSVCRLSCGSATFAFVLIACTAFDLLDCLALAALSLIWHGDP